MIQTTPLDSVYVRSILILPIHTRLLLATVYRRIPFISLDDDLYVVQIKEFRGSHFVISFST